MTRRFVSQVGFDSLTGSFSVKVFEQGADHKAAASYDPNRSYTIDITGHGASAVKALGAVEIFDEKLIKFTGLRVLVTGEDKWFDGKGWTGSRGDICQALLEVVSPTVEVHFDTTAEILEEQRGHTQKEHPTVKRQQGQGRMHGRHRQLRCPTAQTMLKLKHTRSK